MNQVACIQEEEPKSLHGDVLSSSKEEADVDNVHVIIDEDASENQVLTVKRMASGEAIPKQPRSIAEAPIPISRLLNPSILEADCTKKKTRGMKSKPRQKKRSQQKHRTVTTGRQDRYDVDSAITNAQS